MSTSMSLVGFYGKTNQLTSSNSADLLSTVSCTSVPCSVCTLELSHFRDKYAELLNLKYGILLQRDILELRIAVSSGQVGTLNTVTNGYSQEGSRIVTYVWGV